MNRLNYKRNHKISRKRRIRKIIVGTKIRPRLSVFISNKNISVQLIDDTNSKSIAGYSSSNKKIDNSTKAENAKIAGMEIAILAKKNKIKRVVLDRNGKLYHGNIKLLAESARENGLEF